MNIILQMMEILLLYEKKDGVVELNIKNYEIVTLKFV